MQRGNYCGSAIYKEPFFIKLHLLYFTPQNVRIDETTSRQYYERISSQARCGKLTENPGAALTIDPSVARIRAAHANNRRSIGGLRNMQCNLALAFRAVLSSYNYADGHFYPLS